MLAPQNMGSAEANHAVYERHPEAYDSRELQEPERALLRRFRGCWADMTMLDLGVGSGRTSYTFAAIAKRYVGIDYSRVMIELSRQRIGEDDTTRFLVCDARRMAETLEERFDLVLFSYNGLDSVGHEDRRTILSQVREVLKDDGHFFFSSHSLTSLPLRASRPELNWRHPVRSAYRAVKTAQAAWRLEKVNRGARGSEQRGWALLRDEAHDFQGEWYYVLPEYQVTQLAEAGFSVAEVYGVAGEAVDPSNPGRNPWLHYLCTPRS
jgi:ubiquinone/menaquinone biosynthesis C-methylase UbiE